MKVEFTPLTEALIPACRDFNERLRVGGTLPFPLPVEVPAQNVGTPQNSATHYVAVDPHGSVRGGVLLVELRGWLKRKSVRLINIQSPLSEGVVDRSYAGVGLQMLRFINDRGPYSYAVGMGGEKNPFPRFLKAAGWLVSPVPFSFSVVNASRFLREMALLRSSTTKWISRFAAATGIGDLGLGMWNMVHSKTRQASYSLELASHWAEGTEAVWEQCRGSTSFCNMRDEAGLVALYPNSQPRLKRFLLFFCGKIVGWCVGTVTQMHNHRIFGDLAVGTLLDGLTSDQHLLPLITLLSRALADMGADVVLTNQTAGSWNVALRRTGFFRTRSNYLFSFSKPLVECLRLDHSEAFNSLHINRGDGDGRIHV